MTRCDPQSPEFLEYYASVLEREASVREGQSVEWMIEGARRARERAAQARIPAQPDLFASMQGGTA